MHVSSFVFLVGFLPVVLLVYYGCLRHFRPIQNLFLFLVSVLFYAWGDPRYGIVVLLSVIGNWGMGLWAEKCRDQKGMVRLVVGFSLLYNLGILILFRYSQIGLAVGISFLTLQALSYVFMICRGQGNAQRNPIDTGLCIAFFPKLLAGPLVDHRDMEEQIHNRRETLDAFAKGVTRFLLGLAKKVILADNLALLADAAFQMDTAQLSAGMAWLGALAYSFQIFLDLSGYSDMAIGLGQMFGFQLPENMDYPYIAKSVTGFCRRYYLSVGNWFREFVYIPMGGNRVESKGRLVGNILVVCVLVGLWHGVKITFLCWSLLFFVLLVIEKLSGVLVSHRFSVLRHIYTLFFVQLGWVLFRSDTIDAFSKYMKAMLGMKKGGLWDNHAYFYLCENWVFLLLALLAAVPIAPWLAQKQKVQESKLVNASYPVLFLLMFLISLAYIAKGLTIPFIYVG